MSSYRPHLIASYEENSGLFNYFQPFLIPEKAFPQLFDAYCWRGQVKRRVGYDFLGRLERGYTSQVITQTTSASATTTIADLLNDASIAVRAATPNPQTYGEIAPGTLTVSVATMPASVFTDNGDGTLTGTNSGTTGTVNYSTGQIVLNFSAPIAGGLAITVTFKYFPMLPVMGLLNEEDPTSKISTLVAFDTTYAYKFVAGLFQEFIPGTTWRGADNNFFWTIDYFIKAGKQIKWVTNFNAGATPDPIRYTDGTSWTNFPPALDAVTNYLLQALILIPYKGYLIALNTYEGTDNSGFTGGTNFPQRARWNGQYTDPTNLTTNWLSTPGNVGGFRDAPTSDTIVSAVIIKDTLIVKFDNSSWKLAYTGVPNNPFRWELINVELGTEATFSVVPFDRGAFSVGNLGIFTDDTQNVNRIDQKIPDFIFDINDAITSTQRIWGVRDFQKQLVYWTFVSSASPKFPDLLLVYNYVNNSFALFNDSFTALSFYYQSDSATWQSLREEWQACNFPWGAGQPLAPTIVGSNQEGYVVTFASQDQDADTTNDTFLSIFGITTGTPVQITVPNHNLANGRFINISGIIGSGSPNPNTLNGGPYYVTVADANTLNLFTWNSATNLPVPVTLGAGGTYSGGGQVTPINGFSIYTKVFVPHYEEGMQTRIPYIDFLLDNTDEGQCTCQFYADENSSTAINDPTSPNNEGLMQSNVLFTTVPGTPTVQPNFSFLENQQKIWQRFFLGNICQNFQLQLTMSNSQLSDNTINGENFIMHAMVLYTSPNARLVT